MVRAVCASRVPCSSAIWGLSLCTDLLGLLSCVALPTPFLSAGSGLAETLLIVGFFFSLNPYPLDRTRLGSSCTGRSGVAFCKARQGKKGVPGSSYLFNHQTTVYHNFPTSPKVTWKGGAPPAQLCPSAVPLLQSRSFVLERPGAGWVEGMSFPLVTRTVSISRCQSCSSAKLSCPTFFPLLSS